jgi:hypothetical protein
LGHVKTAGLSDTLELATIDGAIKIAQDYESETTMVAAASTPIKVEDNGGGLDHAYTITHLPQTVTPKTGTA